MNDPFSSNQGSGEYRNFFVLLIFLLQYTEYSIFMSYFCPFGLIYLENFFKWRYFLQWNKQTLNFNVNT